MQSYVTSHVKLQYTNILADLNQNGIGGLPDVLFPMKGENSARNETTLIAYGRSNQRATIHIRLTALVAWHHRMYS